ncbi:MAG: DUF177 domain-containing protein [Bacteroidota bacterium]
MGELRINISKLSEGIHDYAFDVVAPSLGLDDRFKHVVHVDASLEKNSRQLFLQADLSTTGNFVCDRCLEDFQGNIKGKYSIVYLMENHSTESGGGDEVQLLGPDTNFIDLDEDVRQFLVLAVPQKLLCKEECAGLCPTCGKNRNSSPCECGKDTIDPRWEDLQKMFRN